MQENLIFVIGSPRSGSTLLQRMLGSHTDIATHPEPHIITPLAHLGYFDKVNSAPYDHINAALAIKEFVADLPKGESDYVDACRAYTDTLYGRMLLAMEGKLFLDKTPAYALAWPFLTQLYPKARYVVLTRHPLAVLCSYADSFFEGDYEAAVNYNDILGRYVPAVAAFLRNKKIPFHHLRYEDMVTEPERYLAKIFDFLHLPNQENAVNYGDHQHVEKSHGDPKVKHQKRPTVGSVARWAEVLATDEKKLEIARRVTAPLSEEDIATWGYDKNTLFDPLSQAKEIREKRDLNWMFDSYRFKRRVFLAIRKNIHQNRLGRTLNKVRYYCDVLLRE